MDAVDSSALQAMAATAPAEPAANAVGLPSATDVAAGQAPATASLPVEGEESLPQAAGAENAAGVCAFPYHRAEGQACRRSRCFRKRAYIEVVSSSPSRCTHV